MGMSLNQWQERLEAHFAQLASARSYSDYPLFALEHGLSDEEFEEITSLLHARLAEGSRLGPHWLVWVVYATEQGYDYDGAEYWDSFEARTPRWREAVPHTRRNHLRDWFTKFQTTYHGVKPSGHWAEWFSIIAWPITHAILPRYLQWQFAKTLYDLRYQLAHLETLSPTAIGELLATNSWDTSSRFQEFLQQQELAGRIVIALLSDRAVEGQSPIYLPTLHRLVSDLDEVQSTREWLKETRQLVADRLKGAARSRFGAPVSSASLRASGNGSTREPVRIRPTLMVRRSTASSWSVVIDIPSFGSFARSHSELYAFLRTSRCKIAGTGDTWLPNGWLLSTSRRRALKTWPGAGAPLVRFEQPNQILDQLVADEARLPTGQSWLCKIGGDGLAREIMSRLVRPGRKYIVLSESPIPADHSFLVPCNTDCGGIHAALLSVPDTFSSELSSMLQQFGLQVARTVRIWPAGLSARDFDGEGHTEWLTTEAPCFGIIHDHAVEAFSLRLDNGEETLIKAPDIGIPVFARIAPLPAGRHTLIVKVRRAYTPGLPFSPPAEGVVMLDVREPEPWVPGTTFHAGLTISLDPHDPSLDGFWEGNVGVNILGPAGHHVTCSISLCAANGKELLAEQIATFDLPVTPSDWTKRFRSFIDDEGRAWTYLEATSGRFVIKGDELGEYVLRLERDVTPVRWVCRSLHRVTTVRLIDDTGGKDSPECKFFSFQHPSAPIDLDAQTVMAGYEAPAPGGIFEARHGKFHDTVNISVPPSGRGFADLVFEPDLHELNSHTFPITDILESLKLWSEARLLGPLVGIRRGRVIDRLVNRLYSRLCGQHWAEAEAAYLLNSHSGFDAQKLARSVGGPRAFPIVLSREHDRMETDTDSGKRWFVSVAARYQVSTDQGLCEFALQFASHPHELLGLPKSVLDGLLLDIKDKSVVLRGARLVALLAARNNPGPLGGIFPRWKW